ncbi:MAG: hypothetical protein ABIR81_09915 [Ginsengibacter sp.]
MNFFIELQRRNRLLFRFGLFNAVVALICLVMMAFDSRQISGVNMWLKPFKFYASVAIMVFTMGWLLYYLKSGKAIKRFSMGIVITMFLENALILLQVLRGTTSHYNSSSVFNGMVFSVMGLIIVIFTIISILICIKFFRQKNFTISSHYVWGIRLGLLFFIIFSLEGGIMIGQLQHTVGAPDGGAGLPVTGWSSDYGDLRIAHFLGIHSLQILPLLGYFVARSKTQTLLLSLGYLLIVSAVFVEALAGKPLFF